MPNSFSLSLSTARRYFDVFQPDGFPLFDFAQYSTSSTRANNCAAWDCAFLRARASNYDVGKVNEPIRSHQRMRSARDPRLALSGTSLAQVRSAPFRFRCSGRLAPPLSPSLFLSLSLRSSLPSSLIATGNPRVSGIQVGYTLSRAP